MYNLGTLYNAPLIPHREMVWWYHEFYEVIEDVADLIGAHTSFFDAFMIENTTKMAAKVLKNVTIFYGEDIIRERGGYEVDDYLPREVLLIELGLDFMYHSAMKEKDTISPYVQHKESLPFVYAVYIILGESFLRSTKRYCMYVDQAIPKRLEVERLEDIGERVRPKLRLEVARLEMKARSMEERFGATQTHFYGVVKQVQWHMKIAMAMRTKVLVSFRRLVMQMARKYGRSEQQILDNFQHGSTGLVRAANYFDPNREKAFSGLARNWIQASVLLHLKTEANMCKIPAPLWQVYRKMEQMSHDKGIVGDIPAIAKEMKMTEEQVVEVMQAIQINRPVSLESPLSEDDPGTMLRDNVVDEGESVEDSLSRKSSTQASDYMSALSYKERMVICCCFGTFDLVPDSKDMYPLDIVRERLRQMALIAVDQMKRS